MTRIRRLLAVLCVSVLATLLVAVDVHAARPMQLDDVLAAVRISEPRLSVDSQLVAYVRTTTDLATGRRSSDIWIVPADGSAPPRPLVEHEGNDTAPAFSPDGGRLAFISSRDGTPQVFMLGLADGTTRKLTNLAAGVQPPLEFSPDGMKVAFVSDVYPECPDEVCNRKKREEADRDPVKVHHLTRLLYRHWNEWRENIRHHVFVADTQTGQIVDVTPGDFDSPPSQYESGAIAFSPDGRDIAFVSKRDGGDSEAWSTNQDVWIVPVTGGRAEKLTDNPAADVSPTWSPDGTTIAVRAQRRAGCESDRWYLDLYDRKTGVRRTLFDTPDLSVGEYRFSADGKSVWFAAERESAHDLYVIDSGGGVPKRVLRGGSITSVSPGPGFVVFARSSFVAPADLYRASSDGSAVRALTQENAAWLKEADIPAPESFSVTGAEGARIQYWLLKPPGFVAGKKYPTVFLIHGGPQGAWLDGWSFRWNPSLWAAQGWVVICPNPRGSTGFGQKFVDEISGDWGGKVMTDLFAVFDAVAAMPFVDAERTGIAGASYGGYAVNWIIGQSARFKAAVSHDGVFNLESMALATEELWFVDWEFGGKPWTPAVRENLRKWSPHLVADRIKTPTLIITNELDYRVPVDQGLQMFTVLRRQGVEAEALVFPDEGHWVLKALNSKRWHEAVFGWMRKYLGG